MLNIKALFLPRVLRFFLISLIRIVGIVAICLVIGAEIQEIVLNIQGYASAVKHTEVIANSTISANSSLPLTSASLSAGSSAMSNAMPVTGAANGTVAERTFYAFASDSANATVTPVNSTDPVSATDFCGYVQGTTVPDHDGGIFFSTLFRVLNVFILFFLLVSEIAPPAQIVTNFFISYFHPLSEESSVGFLGGAMIWISTSLLSTDVRTFAMIAAWLMFVVGVFNILLGLVMGPSIRTSRAIFSLKSDSVLPTHTSNNKRSGGSSYPAPSKMDIEFPTPSNGSKSSLGFSGYDIDAYSIYAPPAIPTRPSEMVERSNTPVGIHRARSGKGVVTIKTDPESIPESRISGDSDSHHPPSYPQGRAM